MLENDMGNRLWVASAVFNGGLNYAEVARALTTGWPEQVTSTDVGRLMNSRGKFAAAPKQKARHDQLTTDNKIFTTDEEDQVAGLRSSVKKVALALGVSESTVRRAREMNSYYRSGRSYRRVNVKV